MSSSNTTIHIGFWTNYSKGRIGGSTLTLTNRNGEILIAAIAIFIQLIGGQSWGIIRFITHQLRTTTQARDGLYHQQQATLRNDNSDVSTVWEFTRIAYAWRFRSPKSFRKSIILVLIGCLHLIAFGAASILASHITIGDDEVLIAPSSQCGPWRNVTTMEESILQNFYGDMSMQASGKYVQNCLAESASLPECNQFKRLQLNYTSTKNNTCPFDSLCLGPINSSLYMDTGLIDSREDLGINGRDTNRVQWRKTATCIPITTNGYSKNGTSSIKLIDDRYDGSSTCNYTALFYGHNVPTSTVPQGRVTDPTLKNATYIYTNFVDFKSETHSYAVQPYDLEIALADEVGNLTPIPALTVSDATLTLAFATFFWVYTEPSEDLWLSAHTKLNLTYSNNEGVKSNTTTYFQDSQVSVMACIEQQQICNPFPLPNATSTCTRLRSIYHAFEDQELAEVLSNDRQKAMANAILLQSSRSAFNFVMSLIPLLAQTLAQHGISLPLASNQWILEAENWFTVGLANMQRLMLDYVTGPASTYTRFIPLNQADNDTNLRFICENQIIQCSDYTNFHTLSFCLIFALGVLVFGVNQSLETIVGWCRLRWRSGRWRQRAWWAEGTLQLQRRAFEGMGIRDWELDEWGMVPVTEEGRTFSALRNWDEMLPLVEEQKNTGGVGKQESPTSEDSKSGTTVVHVESKLSPSVEEMRRGSDGRRYSF